MMELEAFLRDGVLPFVGRTYDLERLSRFAEGVFESESLRAAIVTGEAGIGKSRLIEVCSAALRERGFLVLAIRFYPGSKSSSLPLLSAALWNSSVSRDILRAQPDASLNAVSQALRRCARVRPTMIVLEDVHLLSDSIRSELQTLIEALQYETLALIATSRPTDPYARSFCERFIVEDIQLAGFDSAQVEMLWHSLTSLDSSRSLLDHLMQRTKGNPLALRSAIRAVVGLPSPPPADSAIMELVDRSVDVLTHGFQLHLTEEECRDAEQLSTLGEVFSSEAASCLLGPNAIRRIEALVRAHIITPSTLPIAPLRLDASERSPLLFTHSLVHAQLMTSAVTSAAGLLTVLEQRLPIYSVQIFSSLQNAADLDRQSIPQLVRGIEIAIAVATNLDFGTDWSYAPEVLRAALKMFDTLVALKAPPDVCLPLELQLLNTRLSLMRRHLNSDEYKTLAEDLWHLTENRDSAITNEYRMHAYLHRARYRTTYDPCATRRLWPEVEEFVQAYPLVLETDGFIVFLRDAVAEAAGRHDDEFLTLIEAFWKRMLANDDAFVARPERKELVWKNIARYLLNHFADEGQLQERLESIQKLDAVQSFRDYMLPLPKAELYEAIGDVERCVKTVDHSIDFFRQAGLVSSAESLEFFRAASRAAQLGSLEALEGIYRSLEVAVREANESTSSYAQQVMLTLAVLRRNADWLRHILRVYAMDLRECSEDLQFGISELLGQRVATTFQEAAPQSIAVLRYRDLLKVYRLLSVATSPERSEQQRALLVEAIEWCFARKLSAFIPGLLERAEGLLATHTIVSFEKRYDELSRSLERREVPSPDSRAILSLVGQITIKRPGEPAMKVRGARIAKLLALMSANLLLTKPLRNEQFMSLAAEGEPDLRRARTLVKMGIYRIRELLGFDAIDTSGEVPRINGQLVRVDLLDAYLALEESEAALRERKFFRATPSLMQAMAVLLGDVPFPTLYDNFFETAREDLEARLRKQIFDLSKELLSMGDSRNAQAILGRALEALPEDMDIRILLANALASEGKILEAERLEL